MKGNMKQTFIIRTRDDFKKKAHDYSFEDIEDAIQADHQALLKKVEEILEGFINYTDNLDELVDVILKKLKKIDQKF